jgi:hypothetical protein
VPDLIDAVEFLTGPGHQNRETAFRRGDEEAKELAMWDEIVACEEAGKSWPGWARKALVVYAKKKYADLKFAGQQRIMDDYATFEAVELCLKYQSHTTKSGQVKPFTLRGAFRTVAKSESPEAIQNVRRSYERARKRNENGYYTSHLFLKMLSARAKKSS